MYVIRITYNIHRHANLHAGFDLRITTASLAIARQRRRRTPYTLIRAYIYYMYIHTWHFRERSVGQPSRVRLVRRVVRAGLLLEQFEPLLRSLRVEQEVDGRVRLLRSPHRHRRGGALAGHAGDCERRDVTERSRC